LGYSFEARAPQYFALDPNRWFRSGDSPSARGRPASIRTLNDLDFIAEGFECAPPTLAGDFLFRHVHLLDPQGKTLLQFIDADTRMRIDLFRASGAIMNRNICVNLPSGPIQIVSVEDLAARTAKLVLDLAEGHLKPKHALTFQETNAVLQHLIPSCSDLLISPEYSEHIAQVCLRCMPTPAFQLGGGTTPLP
jgi:hypothetical protein